MQQSLFKDEDIFIGTCFSCKAKSKIPRKELNISKNMFGEEFCFVKCDYCKLNTLAVRLTLMS